MGVRTDRAVAIEIIIEETDRRTSTGQKYRKSFNMTAVVRGGAVRLDIDTIYLTCAPSLSHLY
jgi:hypothetical protein